MRFTYYTSAVESNNKGRLIKITVNGYGYYNYLIQVLRKMYNNITINIV